MASGNSRGGKSGKKKKNKQSQVNREVLGVCLIALGLFFGVSMYSDAVGVVGSAVSSFFFGMFGVLGYVAPVLFAALGVAFIATSKKKSGGGVYALAALGILCIMVMLHSYYCKSVENLSLFQYYKEAYTLGSGERRGGGLLGALLAYPSLLWLGSVGTYIFFGAGTLVCLLLVTRISIKSAAEQVGKTVKAGVESITEYVERGKKQPLYVDSLGEEEAAEKPARGRKNRHQEVGTVYVQDMRKVKNADAELDILPQHGAIEKKRGQAADIFDEDYFVEPGEPAPAISEEEITRISRNAPRAEAEAAHAAMPNAAPQNGEAKRPAEALGTTAQPELMEYQKPPYTLLNTPAPARAGSGESPVDKGKLLVSTLASFNISARITNISVGPVITRFELQPAQGVRVNRITTLANDIALALAAPRVRIEAPIPGKAAVGIEVPNTDVTGVYLREIVESAEFTSAKSPITIALGKDIAGNVLTADLDKMPHLLIAGSTGSGKSVCINDIIVSMIYKSPPEDLRMILVDPKVVELKVFTGLPHLLLPVVTDAKKAASALKWAIMEMNQRYHKMSEVNAKDIARYNAIVTEPEQHLPQLVIIIDELADLMMVAAKDVEESVCRIAQLGRAAGIHLIVATQRPSTDIITGLIKANIPSRIAFMVSSAVDSRVILDTNGAEKLIGRGDMLFHANGASKPVRAQGAYVSDEEVERIMDFFLAVNPQPAYSETVMEDIATEAVTGGQGNGKQEDELLGDAVKIVLDSGQASISMLQRRLRVGYARAARLIDIMEQQGIVSGFDGSKPRKLLIGYAEYNQMFGAENGGSNDE